MIRRIPACHAVLLFVVIANISVARGDSTDVDSSLLPRVKIETTKGDFVLELNASEAPLTVMNFVEYVKKGHYDGLVFHRVLPGSLIQGGAFLPNMTPRTHDMHDGIGNEWKDNLSNVRSSVSIFRNILKPKTTQAEFFINVAHNINFDEFEGGRYSVFGRVAEGMDVVDQISEVEVASHPSYAAGRLAVVPVEPVIIKTARLISDFDAETVKAVIRKHEQDALQEDRQQRLAWMKDKRETIARFEKDCGRAMTVTESNLMYCDVKVGRGAMPGITDRVIMNFRGTLMDGKVVDDTFEQDMPPTKRVSGLIEGMKEAVMGMSEGGIRRAIVPADLAFGEEGMPGFIPKNADLAFEIELFEVRVATD